jgi:hypothetical protein
MCTSKKARLDWWALVTRKLPDASISQVHAGRRTGTCMRLGGRDGDAPGVDLEPDSYPATHRSICVFCPMQGTHADAIDQHVREDTAVFGGGMARLARFCSLVSLAMLG